MKSLIKPLIFALLALLVAGVVFSPSRRDKSSDTVPAQSEKLIQPSAATNDSSTMDADATIEPEAAPATVVAPLTRSETTSPMITASSPSQPPFVPLGYVPLAKSPVAQQWLKEEGVTPDDIVVAQERLRLQGYPPHRLDDPGLVRPFLPRRDIVSVNVTNFSVAERAASGTKVPFRLSGVMPDASFSFTRFDIEREGEIIRIRPIGNASGAVTPGVEIPVDLEGALEPLPPGTYQIEFPELGPKGFFPLVID